MEWTPAWLTACRLVRDYSVLPAIRWQPKFV